MTAGYHEYRLRLIAMAPVHIGSGETYTAKNYIYETVIPHIKKHEIYLTDYKSALQEATQMNKHTLDYVLVKEIGPAHDKTYEIEVKIDNIVYGKGIGKSKKEAEQMAAKDALSKKANNK